MRLRNRLFFALAPFPALRLFLGSLGRLLLQLGSAGTQLI
jgi:hypothetical protein